MMIDLNDYATPLGEMRAATRDGRVCGLGFVDSWERVGRGLAKRFDAEQVRYVDRDVVGVGRAIARYFAGDSRAFTAVDLDAVGTPFQQRVWAALQEVAPGETISYRELAIQIGARDAVRAVGTASGANPVCLAIPCHRMIRSDGSLGGYAGGLDRKSWLLDHELAHRDALAS